jgi:DNA polymerase-3 subunit beta
MELLGFLVECNEDDGFIYITASSLETSIKRKFKASIEEGGSIVVNARMFLGITERLGGEDVLLEYDGKLLGITSEQCRYDIPVLDARNYPKPDIPFPDDLLKISGICSLYSKTSASVGTDNKKPSLTGIHLDIYSDTVQASSCDTNRLAVTENKCDCGGKLSVTIPKQSFFYLANAVDDKDTLEMGLCGGSVVFMKSDMLFSTRIIAEPFLNIDRLLKPADKKLVAKIKSADVQNMISTVSMITSVSEDTAPVALKFNENDIRLSVESTEATSSIDIPADIIDGAGGEFYYNPKYFTDMMKVIRGDVEVYLTTGGILYVSNAVSEYMLMNTRNRTVKRKAKKAVSKIKEKKAA